MSPLRVPTSFDLAGTSSAISRVWDRGQEGSVFRNARNTGAASRLPYGQEQAGDEILTLSAAARKRGREALLGSNTTSALGASTATSKPNAADSGSLGNADEGKPSTSEASEAFTQTVPTPDNATKSPISNAVPSAESGSNAKPQTLSPEEVATVSKLRERDREVRIHEQAHKAVGGALAGAISLTYQRGPDGQNYAVGGAVSIDTSPIADDPEATLRKMRQVQAAALAPADPSGPDRNIAATASANAAQAMIELAKKRFAAMTPTSATQTETNVVEHSPFVMVA